MTRINTIFRPVSGLLLVVYIPIALFMGLQHHHGTVLAPAGQKVPHQDSGRETASAEMWTSSADIVPTHTPYCPACHFQARTALAVDNNWFSYFEIRHVFAPSGIPAFTDSRTITFSERAPPLF